MGINARKMLDDYEKHKYEIQRLQELIIELQNEKENVLGASTACYQEHIRTSETPDVTAKMAVVRQNKDEDIKRHQESIKYHTEQTKSIEAECFAKLDSKKYKIISEIYFTEKPLQLAIYDVAVRLGQTIRSVYKLKNKAFQQLERGS